jgi:signal peptidase I
MRAASWLKNIADFVVILAIAIVAKTALAEPFYVPSGSMEPTLLIGDELLATKFPYGYSTASLPSFVGVSGSERVFGSLPERGDVVVFRWPGDPSQIWVKRVIGLPGDRVAMRNGRVAINGTLVPVKPDGVGEVEDDGGRRMPAARLIEELPGGRSHLIFKQRALTVLDNMDEITVPPSRLFVMGDNRDNSADSRVPLKQGGVGLLPVGNLVGRVDDIIGSWDLGLKHQPVWTWPQGLRLARFFIAVH